MPETVIRHALTGRTLFAGRFAGIRYCLEAAVMKGVDMAGADLRHANLANAELDGARLKGARFDHANLSGANMSEGELDGAVFACAALQNTCLCFTALNHCDFTGASFGATDIAGARIDGARFSTLSAFSLNFRDAETLAGCLWFNEDGMPCAFSRPPVAVTGLLQPVILLDRHVQIGPVTLSIEDWAGPKSPPGRRIDGQGLHPFINAVRKPLNGLERCRAPAGIRA
jgi:hypothetical protein